jgi:hypothetical protein
MVKHHKINEGVDIGKRHDVEGGTSLSETVGVLYSKFACSLGIPGIIASSELNPLALVIKHNQRTSSVKMVIIVLVEA